MENSDEIPGERPRREGGPAKVSEFFIGSESDFLASTFPAFGGVFERITSAAWF